jgi:hypothetical protein
MATDTRSDRSTKGRAGERGKRSGRAEGPRGRDTNANAEDRRFLESHGDRLSDSTRRARWIHSPDERPERKGQTLATRSPDVIRAWAEARGGRAATATRGDDGRPRTLRIRFAEGDGGARSSRLEEIPWEEWLGVFTERDLVFLYQEERRDGRQSNFFRLDNPNREDG